MVRRAALLEEVMARFEQTLVGLGIEEPPDGQSHGEIRQDRCPAEHRRPLERDRGRSGDGVRCMLTGLEVKPIPKPLSQRQDVALG